MAVSVKCVSVDETRRFRFRRYALTLSGNYTTGGDTVDFTSMSAANRGGNPRALPPTKPLPGSDQIDIDKVPNGYGIDLNQNGSSPTIKNYLLKITTTANTELAAGAYPAALTASPVEVTIITPKSDG